MSTLRRIVRVLLAVEASIAAGACAESDGASRGVETGLRIELAALSYPGVEDVCYSFAVASAASEVVIARGPLATLADVARNPAFPAWTNGAALQSSPPVCATQFGNGAGGDWSYVAPCDASVPGDHTVTLWLDTLTVDGAIVATPGVDYQDPCPTGCTLQAACQENADTPVTFNITVMRRAQQGFFDIGVNFDDIFCAAKVDCLADGGDPLTLLHHPETGLRGQTAVLGLACTAGAGAEGTVLLRDPITLTCGPEGETVFTFDPAQPEGNVYTASTGANPAPAGSPVWQVAVYAGQEALECGGEPCQKVYWNIALGFDPLAEGCTLTTAATAGTATSLTDLTTPEASTWPIIEVDVDLTLPGGGLACAAHPLNGTPTGVSTSYTSLTAPRTFSYGFDGLNFALPGTTCSFSGDPTCGWQNALGTHALHTSSTPLGLRTQTHGLIGTRSFSAALLLKDGSPIDSTGDFYFEGEVTGQSFGISPGNGSIGFVYRYQDAQNFYFVAIQPEYAGPAVIIVGWQNGVLFQPLRVSPSVSLGVTYTVGLEVTGATHRVYLDGVLRGTWTDPQDRFTTGAIGVGTLHQAIATFDNLSFEPL